MALLAAQQMLGVWYATGQCAPKDLVEAYAWLTITKQKLKAKPSESFEIGAPPPAFNPTLDIGEPAQRALATCEQEMTAQQIAQAKERVAAITLKR